MKKNKTILILTLIAVVLVILISLCFFGKKQPLVGLEGSSGETQVENQAADQPETNSIAVENKQLVTDDFSIELPVGWSKIDDEVEGVLAIAMNLNETVQDEAAKKINFKSYLAVSLDVLQGKTLEEYVQFAKGELQKSISGISFDNENEVVINERSARAFEAEMVQQEITFKVLIVAIKGEGDDVWVISCNTLKSSWDDYREMFAESVKSFVLKK
jgi:hypothetical protein